MVLLSWLQTFALGGSSAAASATLSGSVSITEQQVAEGFQSILIILNGTTWNSGGTFNKQDIIDGITSAQNELTGWNNIVRDNMSTASVSRISDQIVDITFMPFFGYEITAGETITVIVPASAIADTFAIIATPTIGVTVATYTGIVNSDATNNVPQNFEICQRTGFKQFPEHLMIEWTGLGIRRESIEPRHPQDFVKTRGNDAQYGPQFPEGNNAFVTTSTAPEDL